jgi:Lipocalin-like domain
MKRLMFALIIGLLISGSSLAQQSLVGTYKMVSQVRGVKGSSPTENMGKSPRGNLIFTPTHVIAFWTAETRKPGTSVAEKAALFDTLGGFSGRYRVEGSKLIVSVDASWSENWTGKDQIRNIQWSGNRLTLTTNPQPSGRDPSQTVVVRQVWEKIE